MSDDHLAPAELEMAMRLARQVMDAVAAGRVRALAAQTVMLGALGSLHWELTGRGRLITDYAECQALHLRLFGEVLAANRVAAE